MNHSTDTFLGSMGGLQLVLNAEQYDYVYHDIGLGSEAGFLINIHDPHTRQLTPAGNAYFAPVGSTTRISINKEKLGL